ncbi:serpin family protein [Paenibacillus sp. IB182496]|uniref:Serpin family protein n=1 Tax=Paenibacillus sabuli TaxID=2772509 RepID=A0A927GS71_9BACL|nr:serpin family protein [Paenibacillus sabuli]MBD2845730.1 serpin family protein [Paenibacillus sabuli]
MHKKIGWRMRQPLIAGLVLAMLVTGCGGPQGNAPLKDEQPEEDRSVEPKQTSSYTAADLDPRIAEAHTAFGLALLRQLEDERVAAGEAEADGGTGKAANEASASPANRLISPTSIATIFALVANGARGATRDQMLETLGMHQLSPEVINEGHLVLADLLEHMKGEVELKLANSIWAREGVALREPFAAIGRQSYGAEAVEVDFEAPETAQRINEWVSAHTAARIDRIVSPELIKDQQLLLINALAFEGNWSAPFDEAQTRPAPFYAADGTSVQAETMHAKGWYGYQEGEGYQAIRLPYRGSDAALHLVLPAPGAELGTWVQELTLECWSELLDGYAYRQVELALPKFALEDEILLNEALESLGMNEPFDAAKADFGALAEQDLYVDAVKHKTRLEVDEQGTVAAAVTSVGMAASAPPEQAPAVMRVDRPFFLALVAEEYSELLFAGTVRRLAES